MSEQFEFSPVVTQNIPAATQISTEADTQNRTNFWLIVVVIILVVVLISLVAIFVLVPYNSITSNVDSIESNVTTLAPKVDQLSTNGQFTLGLVQGFVTDTQANIDTITEVGEQTLDAANDLIDTAENDLNDFMFDFCNINGPIITIGGTSSVDINMRPAFPTFCEGVPYNVTPSAQPLNNTSTLTQTQSNATTQNASVTRAVNNGRSAYRQYLAANGNNTTPNRPVAQPSNGNSNHQPSCPYHSYYYQQPYHHQSYYQQPYYQQPYYYDDEDDDYDYEDDYDYY